MGRNLLVLGIFIAAFGARLFASATLLLEEPYGKLGFFTPTGHVAVYLSGVCAQTPLVLRRCSPGESGVVLSRYDGVAGYDWIAIPFVPYLYAVDDPENVPLFADAKIVAWLRDRYRRTHLQDIVPDLPNGGTPGGNWYELAGASYDRTIYGFQIETSAEQDEALILKLNSSPNRSHFRLLTRNCADFAKNIINLYEPKALHRSYFADLGISTPEQMARSLTHFTARHRELKVSHFIIPQIPGSIQRSGPVHRVIGSFFKSKKYIAPIFVADPIAGACVATAYFATGGGRFNPRHDAMVLVPGKEPELPLTPEERRAYREVLKHLLGDEMSSADRHHAWEQVQSKAEYDADQWGRPRLRANVGTQVVEIGLSAEDIQSVDGPSQLVQALLAARLESELQKNSAGKVSDHQIVRDLRLLRRSMEEGGPEETSIRWPRSTSTVRASEY